MKDFFLFVILLTKFVKFLFVFTNCDEQLGIGLLSREKLMNHLLNIAVTGGSSNFLKSLFKMPILGHFVIHLLFQELTPKFLHLEVSACSNLTLIPILVSCRFSNLLLFLYSIDSFLERLLFVLYAVLKTDDSLIPFLLLVLDVLH